MKKWIAAVVCLVCILSWSPYDAAAESSELSYEIVVPPQYYTIKLMMSADRFVTQEAMGQCLRDLDGNALLSAEEIVVYGDWVYSRDGDDVMLYTHDLTPLLPNGYSAVTFLGPTECVATKKEDASWRLGVYGQQDRFDLNTGEMQSLPKGWSQMIDWDRACDPWGEDRQKYSDGRGNMHTAETVEPFLSNADVYSVRNRYGQIIIPEFHGSMAAAREYIEITSGIKYLYTRRGRLVTSDPDSFNISWGGNYIANGCGDIVTPIGDVVVAAEDHRGLLAENSMYYNSGSHSGDLVIDRDCYWTFSVNGSDGKLLYGIMKLPKYTPAPDSWAKDEVKNAERIGLMDEHLKFWWRDRCTREEFCRMLMRAIEVRTGKTAEHLTRGLDDPDFFDAIDPPVIAAIKLQIVQGIGNGSCAPDKLITRQEAATLLMRTAAYLGIESGGQAIQFDDMDQVSPWAKGGVAWASSVLCGDEAVPLMQGTRPGYFSPNSMYTVEQAAITLYRLLQT